MSQPGYLASFEEDSEAQQIAAAADVATEAAVDGLRAPTIAIPLEGVLDEQARFAALSADGHRGTAGLYRAYASAELLDREAQLNYDMFRDAALPAETAGHRFAMIAAQSDFHLSEESLQMMTKNTTEVDAKGSSTLQTSPLQDAGVTEGASVTESSAAVSLARRSVRVAHDGIKLNLLEVKQKLFEEKKKAKEEELGEYEAKIARVGKVLDFVALAAGGATAASAVVGAVADGATAADRVGAGGEAGGFGTSVVQFGAELAMGKSLDQIRTEIASHAMFIAGIAGLSGGLEAARNLNEFGLALAICVQAREDLQAAVETRRKQYARAGMQADARLIGTVDEGDASRAMLFGSAAQEAQVFLDAAVTEHDAARRSVDAAKANGQSRKRTWWYRDEGSFYSYETELEKENLGGGPDLAAVTRMGAVLVAWKQKAETASAYLDEVTAQFEGNVLHPAGAGGKNGDVY